MCLYVIRKDTPQYIHSSVECRSMRWERNFQCCAITAWYIDIWTCYPSTFFVLSSPTPLLVLPGGNTPWTKEKDRSCSSSGKRRACRERGHRIHHLQIPTLLASVIIHYAVVVHATRAHSLRYIAGKLSISKCLPTCVCRITQHMAGTGGSCSYEYCSQNTMEEDGEGSRPGQKIERNGSSRSADSNNTYVYQLYGHYCALLCVCVLVY